MEDKKALRIQLIQKIESLQITSSNVDEIFNFLTSFPGVNINFIHNLLDLYLLNRKNDIESAARRFIALYKLIQKFPDDISFVRDDDIKAVERLKIFHFDSTRLRTMVGVEELQKGDANEKNIVRSQKEGAVGLPLIYMVPRNLDWKLIIPRQMKKYIFYVYLRLCFDCYNDIDDREEDFVLKASNDESLSLNDTNLIDNFTAARYGFVQCLMADGISIKKFNREVQKFKANLVGTLPSKVFRIFIMNEPKIFSTFIWPIASRVLPQKIKSRLQILGRNYTKFHDFVNNNRIIPIECGGIMQFIYHDDDGSSIHANTTAESNQQLADSLETISEGQNFCECNTCTSEIRKIRNGTEKMSKEGEEKIYETGSSNHNLSVEGA